MTDIVINTCPRGYLLSEAGCIEYAERKGSMPETLDRADPVLVKMLRDDLETRKWAGECSHVKIITVPNDMTWHVVKDKLTNVEWVAAGEPCG